jgi:hypothetical protein
MRVLRSSLTTASGATLLALSIAPMSRAQTAGPNYVQIVSRDADRRVDILIGGTPFTSYIYPTTLKKPVLYPLRTASGVVVTRGYPLEPRPGERTDHPHHAGLWFNYGNVNGLDFWNNSDAIKPADAPKMGTIVHRAVKAVKSGDGEGTLDVTCDWVNHDGKAVLREDTRFVFHAQGGARSIDRLTTLTALDTAVSFKDDKEGVLGLRVARSLEHPATAPETFVDAAGRRTVVQAGDTTGVTGHYRSSEGKEGDAVWGTRGRWTMLTGSVERHPVTIAILDHPKNPGFPTYWHARGYGLFAANNLGQKLLSNGKEELNFKLDAGASVTFRHEVLLLDGQATTADIERFYSAFSR